MFLISGGMSNADYRARGGFSSHNFTGDISPRSFIRTDEVGKIMGCDLSASYSRNPDRQQYRVIPVEDFLSLPRLPNGDLSPNINIKKYPTLSEVMRSERNQSN